LEETFDEAFTNCHAQFGPAAVADYDRSSAKPTAHYQREGRQSVNVTVYNSNIALVRETRT